MYIDQLVNYYISEFPEIHPELVRTNVFDYFTGDHVNQARRDGLVGKSHGLTKRLKRVSKREGVLGSKKRNRYENNWDHYEGYKNPYESFYSA